MIDLTKLFVLLIELATLVVCLFLIPLLKSKTTKEQREDLLKWADIAVAAAQQLFYHHDGKVRLSYALGILAEKGFDINSKAVCDAVEAAVLKLHQEMSKETLENLTPPAWAQGLDEEAIV